MTRSLPSNFVLRSITVDQEIAQIGYLRVLAWNSVLPTKLLLDSWLDEFDTTASHWGIFHDGHLVAAARLTLHDSVNTIPDTVTFSPIADMLPNGRFGLLGRLVVHPDCHGLGLSEWLDEVRIEMAEQAGCQFVLAATADQQRRVSQLTQKGFFILGKGQTIPIAELLGLPTLLLCPLPRINEGNEKNKTIPTLNKYGWHGTVPNQYSQAFVQYAALCSQPVLDLGAGLGIATRAALAAGATIIANDLEPLHLLGLRASVPTDQRARLTLLPGRFPDQISLPAASLGAVHASNLFHFLTGAELQRGLASIVRWLQLGGQLFVTTASPYQRYLSRFIPVFEQRKAAGETWPGFIANTSAYYDPALSPHAAHFLHVLDTDQLRQLAEQAGFVVEKVKFYSREGLPDFAKLDGREHVGLMAQKPQE